MKFSSTRPVIDGIKVVFDAWSGQRRCTSCKNWNHWHGRAGCDIKGCQCVTPGKPDPYGYPEKQ